MDLATHWDTVYANKDSQAVSWYQPRPEVSLRLIARVAEPGASIVDVGAGASTLVDHLVQAGYDDVLLLDIARSALEVVRRRLGCIDAVRTQVADIRTWVPSRQFDVWHDRAVFHFLTDPSDRATYRRALFAGVPSGGHVIVSAFHSTGPDICSELPTARYDAPGLHEALGGPDVFELVHHEVEQHPHPRGGTQAFQVVLLRRR